MYTLPSARSQHEHQHHEHHERPLREDWDLRLSKSPKRRSNCSVFASRFGYKYIIF